MGLMLTPIAVYTGDSANYHIFQIASEEGDVVGSIYLSKKEDIPEGLDITLITPNRDKFLWRKNVEDLKDRARDGSKAEAKLKRILKKHE
jgi:hypothetical protein